MQATFDIDQLRSETPGCGVSAFFNHSGASLPSTATMAAVSTHLEREALHGGMEAAAAASSSLDAARTAAASLVNASPNDVAFTSSASAAIGLAFAAMPPLREGDRILVGRHEWGGNVSTYSAAAARVGAHVEVIPCREDGGVNEQALSEMIDDRVRLVSLTWVPANGGLVNDAQAIGRVTSSAKVPYFIDAGQALGQIPIDVNLLQCDVLKGTGRKYLRGPRGTAMLYVRKSFVSTLRPAFLDVQSGPWSDGAPVARDDARVFETVEGPFALLLGLGSALKQAQLLGIANIEARIVSLAQTLREDLSQIRGVTVHDLGTRRCGLVSFTINGMEMPEVRRKLAGDHIVVGGNGVTYTPFDMVARGLREVVRASISYFNTEAEVKQLVDAIHRLSRHSH